LFRERFKSLISGKDRPAAAAKLPAPHKAAASSGSSKRRIAVKGETFKRNSNGLEQFFFALRDTSGLSILDLSAASQANISYITNLGHRIYAEDFLDCVDQTFPEDNFFEAQADAQTAQQVLDQCLNFPPGHFDGALAWDGLQFVAPPLLGEVVDRLYEILRPNAYLLAYFSADERAEMAPHHDYRIEDGKTLLLTPRSQRPPAQHFSSRSLEKLFSRYQQIKFFLTRDNLREVLVKR
jgi:hypothetical protein